MAHAIKIGEEVEQELLRQGVPQPGAPEAECDRPEFSLKDRQEIGCPAFDSCQVSLLRICCTLTRHERARRRHVFVYAPLTGTAVAQRHGECWNPAFCLIIDE